MTVEDMYKNLSNPIEKAYKNQMDMLLRNASNMKDRSIMIFYTDRLKDCDSKVLVGFIEKWWKIHSEEQTNSQKSYRNNEVCFSNPLNIIDSVISLVKDQMQEFVIYRDPIILSNLKPVFFVNIGK